jgi:tyrosyl-tRNA synthetase
MEEVKEYGRLKGSDLRTAKEVLAFEATKIVHGEEEAEKARTSSRKIFGSFHVTLPPLKGYFEAHQEDSVPTTFVEKEQFIQGIAIFKLFEKAGLCPSGSEARRLIEQGGGYLNNKKVDKFDLLIKLDDFSEKNEILLRAGKKKFHRIKIVEKN